MFLFLIADYLQCTFFFRRLSLHYECIIAHNPLNHLTNKIKLNRANSTFTVSHTDFLKPFMHQSLFWCNPSLWIQQHHSIQQISSSIFFQVHSRTEFCNLLSFPFWLLWIKMLAVLSHTWPTLRIWRAALHKYLHQLANLRVTAE